MNTAIAFHDAQVDSFAEHYQRSPMFQERFSIWKTLLDTYVQPHHMVVDLGCGTGIFSRYLAEKGCRVTGVDGSEAMIAHCRRLARFAGEQYVQLILPSDDMVSYPAQDVILLSSVLEYVSNYEKLLRQAHQLLRPGGLLLVSVPNRNSLYRWLETCVFWLLKRPRYRGHSGHAFTKKTFSAAMSQSNFSSSGVTYYGGQRLLTPLLRTLFPKKYVDALFVGVYRKESPPYQPTHEDYQYCRYAAQHSESSCAAPGFSGIPTR